MGKLSRALVLFLPTALFFIFHFHFLDFIFKNNLTEKSLNLGQNKSEKVKSANVHPEPT